MKYLLIGGLSPSHTNYKIERTILDLVDKPIILYVALATDNYTFNLTNLKKALLNLPILILDKENIKYLNLDDLFKKVNVIYFTGGTSQVLIDYAKDYNLNKYFTLENIKLICGLSAGAILLAKYGMGDRDAFYDNGSFYNFKMVEGLGVLPITFCPHYQKNELVEFDDICKNYPYDAYALEDDTAILFDDSRLIKVIKNQKDNSCYKLLKKDNYLLHPLYERKI